MDIKEFQTYADHSPVKKGVDEWLESRQKNLFIKGLIGSAPAVFLHNAGIGAGRSVVFILHDEEEAGYFYNDLQQYEEADKVFYFPSSYKKRIKEGMQKDAAN
ncbi:MAG: hypothetical protein J6U24_06250 [Paludibacteraceae bacterium]|nr:hypothetical protein [Paludibacteraceae bacterium]